MDQRCWFHFIFIKTEVRYWKSLESTGSKHWKKAKTELCNWIIKTYQIEPSYGRCPEDQNSVRQPRILIGTSCATLRKKRQVHYVLSGFCVETLKMGICSKSGEKFLTLDILKYNYKQLKKKGIRSRA